VPAAPPRWSALHLAVATAVAALGFLLASTPARNSDALLHLAAGRAFLNGTYHLGVDPFAFTTQGRTWVNHSWLYDVCTYGLYAALGGWSVVVCKALLIAGVALLMLLRSRVGSDLGLPALSTALALIALSPSVPLDPLCVSCLFLALTLWLLDHAERLPPRFLSYLPLVLLFVLWVNLDAWFILGPLVVALHLVGRWLHGWGRAQKDPALPVLSLVLLAGLIACLLNPHHVRAFALPPPLTFSAAAVFGTDPLTPTLQLSPFQPAYVQTVGATVPGIAYYLLAVVSLLSFWFNRQQWSWPRALLWLTFFLLSACHVRLIPFFAIVAGPILAVNSQQWLARRAQVKQHAPVSPAPAAPVLLSRLRQVRLEPVALVLLLLLLVAAWLIPDRTQTPQPRGWAILRDRGLENAARQLVQWRQDGRLDDRPTLNLTMDVGNYLAWAGDAPREKSFVDSRLALFSPATLKDFVTVRQGLFSLARLTDPKEAPADWRAVLRKYRIGQVIVSENNLERFRALQRALLGQPATDQIAEWSLISWEGRTAILGWHDPRDKSGDRFAALRLNLDRLAYQPVPERQAPPQGAGRLGRLPRWQDPFLRTRPARSPEVDEAALHLMLFDDVVRAGQYGPLRQKVTSNALDTAAVGWAAPVGNLAAAAVNLGLIAGLFSQIEVTKQPTYEQQSLLALGNRFRQGVGWQVEDGPDAPLWLALRAARRALAADPDDASAYFLLGKAYLRLATASRERALGQRFGLVNRLRRIQAAVALNEAQRLDPINPLAHELLAEVYMTNGFDDLAVNHLQEELRILRDADARLGPSNRLEQMEKILKERQKHIKPRLAGQRLVVQVALLTEAGLGGQALDLLRTAGKEAESATGLQTTVSLMLLAGEAREVVEDRDLDLEKALDPETAHLLQLELAAALGNYERADRQAEALQDLATDAKDLRRRANLDALRGLLALEQGQSDRAEAFFQQALGSAASPDTDVGSRLLARYYLDRIRATAPGR
jgi:tetratricopeptide (TPR) repeat protein